MDFWDDVRISVVVGYSGPYRMWPNASPNPNTGMDLPELRWVVLVYGGDPCPDCGAILDYDEHGEDREPFLIHPDPQCGWKPDGYPARVLPRPVTQPEAGR